MCQHFGYTMTWRCYFLVMPTWCALFVPWPSLFNWYSPLAIFFYWNFFILIFKCNYDCMYLYSFSVWSNALSMCSMFGLVDMNYYSLCTAWKSLFLIQFENIFSGCLLPNEITQENLMEVFYFYNYLFNLSPYRNFIPVAECHVRILSGFLYWSCLLPLVLFVVLLIIFKCLAFLMFDL